MCLENTLADRIRMLLPALKIFIVFACVWCGNCVYYDDENCQISIHLFIE